MHYRRLGKSGLQTSALSLGSWTTFGERVSNDAAERLMSRAYAAGVNLFDTAENYAKGQAEEVMGSLLRRFGWPRSTYLVSSKVFWGGDLPNQTGLSRKRVFEACHASLRRLGLDYLDLYYCHRPDPNTPIEETVRAMDTLVQQGKILYWGTSEWSAQQITEAHLVAREQRLTPPTMEQPEYNMLRRQRVENEYQGLCQKFGMGLTTFSPLASGLLTGKYNQDIPADSRMAHLQAAWFTDKLSRLKAEGGIEIIQQLDAIARKLGANLAQLSIAWCLKNPHVSSVLLGASKLEQLEQNLAALDTLKTLDEDTYDEIELAISRFREIDA